MINSRTPRRMAIRDWLSVRNRLDGYEQASVLGLLLTVLGSLMGWLVVTADQDAAAQLDDIEAGTTTFTGTDLGFGAITLLLAVVAAVLLGLVLWRYRAAGRKTGLVVMLAGLVAGGVAVVGIVLTGALIGQADQLQGVSVDLGVGIFVTLLGALLTLSGGVLRLAAGPPAVEEATAAE